MNINDSHFFHCILNIKRFAFYFRAVNFSVKTLLWLFFTFLFLCVSIFEEHKYILHRWNLCWKTLIRYRASLVLVWFSSFIGRNMLYYCCISQNDLLIDKNVSFFFLFWIVNIILPMYCSAFTILTHSYDHVFCFVVVFSSFLLIAILLEERKFFYQNKYKVFGHKILFHLQQRHLGTVFDLFDYFSMSIFADGILVRELEWISFCSIQRLSVLRLMCDSLKCKMAILGETAI